MQIAMRARHAVVSESLRELIEEKLVRVARFFEGTDRIEVAFCEERNPRIPDKITCDVALHGRRGVIRAHASAADILASVDAVVEKVEHRIEKVRGRQLLRGGAHK